MTGGWTAAPCMPTNHTVHPASPERGMDSTAFIVQCINAMGSGEHAILWVLQSGEVVILWTETLTLPSILHLGMRRCEATEVYIKASKTDSFCWGTSIFLVKLMVA